MNYDTVLDAEQQNNLYKTIRVDIDLNTAQLYLIATFGCELNNWDIDIHYEDKDIWRICQRKMLQSRILHNMILRLTVV